MSLTFDQWLFVAGGVAVLILIVWTYLMHRKYGGGIDE